MIRFISYQTNFEEMSQRCLNDKYLIFSNVVTYAIRSRVLFKEKMSVNLVGPAKISWCRVQYFLDQTQKLSNFAKNRPQPIAENSRGTRHFVFCFFFREKKKYETYQIFTPTKVKQVQNG